MSEHLRIKITAFMKILKALGLGRTEIFGICSLLENEQMMMEMIKRLGEKDFNLTADEVINICGTVIRENFNLNVGQEVI